MTGCRHGAKNTLNENYLHLAEKAGAVVHPMTTVRSPSPRTRGADCAVTTVPTDAQAPGRGTYVHGAPGRRRGRHVRHPDPAAPDEGHRAAARASRRGSGELTRTNSEALVGAQTDDRRYRRRHGTGKVDFTRGVAITSSIHPDDNTHIEPVRYGKGSNAMGAPDHPPGAVQHPGPGARAGSVNWPGTPLRALRSLSNRRWSERTIIGLVMQSLDNSLTTYRKPGGLGKGLLTARQGHGAPNPDQIAAATRAASLLAEEINGFAGSNVGELMGTPLTAHFLGGCPIGASPDPG